MKLVGIIILVLGIVSLVFGIMFLTQVGALKAGVAEAQSALVIVDDQIASLNEGIAAVALVDPGISVVPPAPETAGGAFLLSSMGTATLAKQVLQSGVETAIGLASLVTLIGIMSIIVGVALGLAGFMIFGLVSGMAKIGAALAKPKK